MLWVILVLCSLASTQQAMIFHKQKWTTTNSLNPVNSADIELSKQYDGKYEIAISFYGRDCASKRNITFTMNKNTDSYVKNSIGPDEMYVQLEGMSLLSFLPNFVGCNRYKVGFYVPIDGFYHIKIVHIRSNFMAVNELNPVFPLMEYQYILSEWVSLQASYPTPFKERRNLCEKSSPGFWILNLTAVSLEDSAKFKDFRLANETKPIIHRLVCSEERQRQLPLIRNYVPLDDNHNNSGYAGRISRYNWEPVYCDWTAFTPAQGRQLLKDKAIVVIGDSHARNLFNAFTIWVCEKTRTSTGSRTTSPLCPEFRNVKYIVYNNSMFCERIPSALVPLESDLIIVNCGHHPASGGRGHYTLEQYKIAVMKMHQSAMHDGYTNKNFVWFDSHPQPLRQDRWVIGSRDWRTLHRIKVFNDFSTRYFEENNVTVLSTFQPLLPFIDNLCDFAHYESPHVMYPVFQQILQLLNLVPLD